MALILFALVGSALGFGIWRLTSTLDKVEKLMENQNRMLMMALGLKVAPPAAEQAPTPPLPAGWQQTWGEAQQAPQQPQTVPAGTQPIQVSQQAQDVAFWAQRS